MRKPTMWFPNRSDTNHAVQAQKMVRDWKFWIKKVEELYYPCSENTGVDQLHSLCFRICRLLVFPCGGSYNVIAVKSSSKLTKTLYCDKKKSVRETNSV